MRKDIQRYYSVLELNPGVPAVEIRRAYHQLIRRWHPDRFKPGSVMQTAAEDLTKEINEAYEQLYKKHLYKRFLPKTEPLPAPPGPAVKTPADEAAEPSDNPKPAAPKAPKKSRSFRRQRRSDFPRPNQPPRPAKEKGPRKFRLWRWSKIVIAIGVVVAGVAVWSKLPPRFTEPAENVSGPASVPAPRHSVPPRVSEAAMADVEKSPQAEPVRAEPNERMTTLAKVSRLPLSAERPQSHSPAPLPKEIFASALRSVDSDQIFGGVESLLETFEWGDTQAKVISVQGLPDDASETIFRYGSSLVFFENGLVSDWSDGSPKLHIRAWPKRGLNSYRLPSRNTMDSELAPVRGPLDSQSLTHSAYESSDLFLENGHGSYWVEETDSLILPMSSFIQSGQIPSR